MDAELEGTCDGCYRPLSGVASMGPLVGTLKRAGKISQGVHKWTVVCGHCKTPNHREASKN
jgi:hypothetical protein